MEITLTDSLKKFVDEQVSSGRYPDPDAFIADLLQTEILVFERIRHGEALPMDEHFSRRLEVLLDEAAESGNYLKADKEEFDAMEREALELIRSRRPG